MENLKNLYTNANNDLNYNSQHLGNQRDMSEQLSVELEKARNILKKLKAEKNNKLTNAPSVALTKDNNAK